MLFALNKTQLLDSVAECSTQIALNLLGTVCFKSLLTTIAGKLVVVFGSKVVLVTSETDFLCTLASTR